MKCIRPDLSEKLVLYVEHLLAADEQKEVESHIAGCELCRDEAQALQNNIRLIRKNASSNPGASPSSPCPDDRMLVEFSESPESLAPGDRMMVESHLKSCNECQSILESLQKLSGEIEHFQDVPDKSATMPEAMKARISALYKRETLEPEGFFGRIIRFFQKPRYSVISALAALLLIVGAFTLMLGDMAGRHKSEVSAPPSTQALFTMRPDDESLLKDRKAVNEKSSAKEEASDSGALSPQKMARTETIEGVSKLRNNEKEKEAPGFTDGRRNLADSLKGQDKGSNASGESAVTANKMTAGEANQTASSAQDNALQGAGAGGYAPGSSPLARHGGAPGRDGYGMGGSGGGASAGGASAGTGGMMQGRIAAGAQSTTAAQPDARDNLIVGGSQNIQAQQYSHTTGAAAPSSQNIKKDNADADGTKVKTDERERYTGTEGNRGNVPAQQPAASSSTWVAGRTASAPPSAPRTELQKAPAAAESPKPSMARFQEGAAESKKQRDSEKERLERELAAAGQSYLDRTIGAEKARITVMITPDEAKSSLGVKKIHVVIKSTCALKEKEKTSLVQGISEKLKLNSDRDTVKIEVSPAR
ncbi:MAG: hypothetical protein AB2L14_26810 [Candidatus Xenobiia bacterium LiM19]